MKITRPPASLGEAPPEYPVIELDCGHERAAREGEFYFRLESDDGDRCVCGKCLGEHVGDIAVNIGPVLVEKVNAEDAV